MDKKLLTFEQGCEYLGFKKSYAYKLISAGILPYSKPNRGKVFFDREKLDSWALSNASESKAEKQMEVSDHG